jgi:hypothetical protein
VHFINLGIVVGSNKDKDNPRRYNPLGSLEFLQDDLQKNVGESGRPVVITHHIDVQRYSTACDADPKNAGKEWHPCDARAFHKAIAKYNVVAILYGHTHARNVLKWTARRHARNKVSICSTSTIARTFAAMRRPFSTLKSARTN